MLYTTVGGLIAHIPSGHAICTIYIYTHTIPTITEGRHFKQYTSTYTALTAQIIHLNAMNTGMTESEASTNGEFHTGGGLFAYAYDESPLFAMIILPIIGIFGLAGNILIIYLYAERKSLRNPPNIFFINLAVADIYFLACAGPALYNMAHGKQAYGPVGCLVHGFSLLLSATTSLASMGLIAFSRYVVIAHPKKKSLMTWQLCGLLCVSCWIYSLLPMMPLWFGWGRIAYTPKTFCCGFDFAHNSPYYNVFIFITMFGVVSGFMCFCYYKIYKVFRASKRRVSSDKGKHLSKNELRLAVQLLVVFVIYNMCWSPLLLMFFFIDPEGHSPGWVYGICLLLAFTNSSVNVLIYLYFNRVFRLECLKLVRKQGTTAIVTQTNASVSIRKRN